MICAQEVMHRRHRPYIKEANFKPFADLLRCQSEILKRDVNGRILPRLWSRDVVAALNMKAAVMETIGSVTELNPQGARPARFRYSYRYIISNLNIT